MTREEIKNLIEKVIRELQKEEVFFDFKLPEINVESPKEKTHGDYSTNVAMAIAKQVRRNPIEIAEMIKSKVKIQNSKVFDEIETAKPGFINFSVSKEYLQKQVSEILRQKEKFGKLKIGKGKEVNVEFISANPTGELHLGHGRGAFFGDTISNVLEKAGYKVTREYYINDAKNSNQIRELGKTALGKGVTYLTKNLEFRIKNLESKLKKISDEGEAGYLLAQEVQKDIKEFIEEKLKIKFDNWVSEEDLYKKNKVDKIFNWLKNKNLVYQKEGAWWIKTSEFGDSQDWVVIRSEVEGGEPTYLLSDIVYHKDKFNRGFQRIINIWGADHQGHVQKIKSVAKILGYKGDLDILISQVVRLKGGKISKRKGEIVTLEWLVDEVGQDAARFIYLMKSLDTQMEFDVEMAKERSTKSPVYYVQYAHARICSIFKRIKNYELRIKNFDTSLLNHPSELEFIKQLIRFPEIVEDTAKDYQVQRIPQYAIDLATVFHQFYRDCRVLSENKELTQARLALISATKITLKNTLELLGVSAPEEM